MAYDWREAYKVLEGKLAEQGIDLERVKQRLKGQAIETPSWGYADSGTRFGVFQQPGAAVTISEKLADAAQVHKFTGAAPTVAVHVLWDFVYPPGKPEEADFEAVRQEAESLGVRIGAINPNCFQDQSYKYGSIASPRPEVREQAVAHMLDSIEIGKQVGSDLLSLWFADGTNFPGQADFNQRKHWALECLQTVYRAMPDTMTMLIEYKPFEPGFYHTDIADWGMAYCLCQACGERAKVLTDIGHHLPGTNVPHVVAFLIDEGRFGGFHFNDHKYADDDLTAASIDPYKLYLVYHEIAKAEEDGTAGEIAFMVDQSHALKPKIEAMIQTIMRIQTAYAKALIIPREALQEAQAECDVVRAENIVQGAFNTDVEPLLRQVRTEAGLDPDPLAAYRASGYQQRIEEERGIREGAGLGT
ncbi:MAG: L-rhamnose isomerase [Armatimonadota bacterium]